MATPFLSSEEYDERAHRFYDDGAYDSALETLKEGLKLYPHSVELYVGLGYTRLAREEFVWARQAFERGLVLDPEHEDALVGLGEALLRFGERDAALAAFRTARASGACDLETLLSMGRALYREQLYDEAEPAFREAVRAYAESADAAAGLGYTLHRRGDEAGARDALRRALQLDPAHHEARVYLGHMLYDRGEWAAALRAFERVPSEEHWDALAVERVIELRRALTGSDEDAPEVGAWARRLAALEACAADPLAAMLAEIEEREPPSPAGAPLHHVVLPHGAAMYGSWFAIVRQLRDAQGRPGESVTDFMRRRSEEERVRTGRALPVEDPCDFIQAGARAGLWTVLR
jgi:cytochrome c-type biogenesis protein CcmH/NrfG